MKGIRLAQKAEIPISISTMIHQGALTEFDKLSQFAGEIGAIEWGIDVLCIAGPLKDDQDLLAAYYQGARFMEYAYGGGYHGSSEGFACGRHLMTVAPNGMAAKCGFYMDSPLGDARRGFKEPWLNFKHTPLDSLECKGCAYINECAGGCRFRADSPLAPDPAMCAFFKITPPC